MVGRSFSASVGTVTAKVQSILVINNVATIDVTQGYLVNFTLSGDTTLAVANKPTFGVAEFSIRFAQDNVGGHALLLPAGWLTPSGEQPFHGTDPNVISKGYLNVYADGTVEWSDGEYSMKALS